MQNAARVMGVGFGDPIPSKGYSDGSKIEGGQALNHIVNTTLTTHSDLHFGLTFENLHLV